MPLVPEFIPLAKGKELLAVTSWRDSPGLHASVTPAGANHTLTPSHLSTESGSPEKAERVGPNSDEETGKERARQARGKGGRGRNGRHKSLPTTAADGQEVEDYFVHVLLPPTLPLATFQFELRAQVTPLKLFDLGPPRTLLVPRPVDAARAASSSTSAADNAPSPSAPTSDGPSVDTPKVTRKMVLLPFTTPALSTAPPHSPPNSHGGEEEEGWWCGAVPPDMSLPPAELSATRVGMRDGLEDGSVRPAPSQLPGVVEGEYQVSLLFAEAGEAEKAAGFIRRHWPTQVGVTVVARSRALLNASLVLKGLPSLAKSEVVIQELEQLPCKPSYVRLHRGERGVFKNVIFVKYDSRAAAEESKLRLERLYIASRPLKVEFKKKVSHVVRREDGEEETSSLSANSTLRLQQLVRDLRVSGEHEGFIFQRADLSTEELKLLKQLCQSYTLSFHLTEQRVTVRRYLGASAHHANHNSYNTHTTGHATCGSERPSPALRAQATPMATPAWAPATPAPLRPMDFKGIRHWKEIHSQVNTLGIVRPLGPEDGLHAFAAGRGRPL